MRYLIYFSYDGTNFNGYQHQPGKRTVEGSFEKALFSINNNKKTKIYASGRTDSKVHALRQSAHFDLSITISCEKLKRALNSFLPDDIHVFEVKEIKNTFNARFDVSKKTYKYLINTGEYNPIERNYVYQYCRKLDIKKMRAAIKSFVGKHDFSSFVSNESKKENYERIIFDAEIIQDKDIITIRFIGNGFMKYQVRYMVGTLIKIGSGKYDVDIIDKILKNNSYKRFVSIVKPEGLYLEKVEY